MKCFAVWLVAVLSLGVPIVCRGSSIQPLNVEELVNGSAAVFRGRVVSVTSFRDSDNLIYTRTSLRVNEPFKGTFPTFVQVVHRGGQVDNEDDFYGLSPRFNVGEECLLFVMRRADRRLQATQGYASAIRLEPVSPGSDVYVSPGADWLAQVRTMAAGGVIAGDDVTDQAAPTGQAAQAITGMLNGVNSRFVQPDRGDPISYLIDADSLPAGITLTQATNAV
ncbi:MAG TPA: hypothetical protein VK327_14070, partial [Candidatus Paceibacterota bacterium]|nr:hypothetical protein [Candidatus Paceibacterota bacterium]